MKVCDVVLNSVWHDPRVMKQVSEYLKAGAELVCVGMKCQRFSEEKVAAMPCPTVVVEKDAVCGGKQRLVLKKLFREFYRIRAVRDSIIEQKPDIIHANDLDALIPSYLAKKKLGCRLVYDSHEINCENRIYSKYALYNFVMRMLEKHIVKRCDLMVCVSHAAAEYFADTYKIPKPMVVTNCMREEDVLRTPGDKHEGFEVLNHGKFHDSRGLELMVDSCDLLGEYPDIKMVARGFGGIEKSLKATVAERKLDNFVFYPPVLTTELVPYAAHSHVGVAVTLPVCLNFKLSVSNRLFEYAAAGLPVIMSDIPEHRYLNDRYEIGIVLKDYTPQTFTDAVIRLYNDREFYDRCSRNAIRMSREINWEKEFDRLLKVECAWF